MLAGSEAAFPKKSCAQLPEQSVALPVSHLLSQRLTENHHLYCSSRLARPDSGLQTSLPAIERPGTKLLLTCTINSAKVPGYQTESTP